MKNIFTIIFILCLTLTSKAQWLWDYGVSVGVSNYLGDIGGKEKTRRDFVADMKMAKTRWNVGGFARYKVHQKLSVKLALDYLRIEGDDKLSSNPARNARNLNFRNDMFDLELTGQVFFYEDNDLGNTYRFKNGFRAYFFAGVGGFYSNPKTLDGGVKLRPLETEGKKYSPVGVCIPAGVGFYFTFHKKHRIGYELNYRTTFTDYLDDVSGNYADPSGMSPEAAALSNRTGEVQGLDPKFAKNFGYDSEKGVGNKRGDKTHKDGYMTMSLSYSYVLRGKSSFYRGRYGHFFNHRRRGKIRKIRAKF
ncbi:MAG: outer membrane beta-barrel protein [Bacteroidetes bacterium]|nr:outer membrane beta-barrel protein [Bacteroidota bacterium]